MTKQKGNIQLLAAGALVIIVAGFFAYRYVSGLSEENQRLTKENSELTTERDASIEREKQAKNMIETERKLRQDAEAVSTKHLETISSLNDKLADILRRWPKAIPKDKDLPVSNDQDLRSKQRILLLWEVFCHDNLAHPKCLVGDKK